MALSEPTRRRALARLGALALLPGLAACRDEDWHGTDISGVLPDLAFRMTRASDGREVTEADYRGQVVALFFGYTFCPDICPMTLANLSQVAGRLDERARKLSILFVTVDPARDTPDVLRRYVASFTPRADGLRGGANRLQSLARRYRVTYRVRPDAPEGYSVSHGPSVYVFDAAGAARVMLTRFDTAAADIAGATGDIRRIMHA